MTASGAVSGLPKDQHDYGTKHGIPPIAAKLALIDFDGTIVPWGPLMGVKDPEPGAVEAILFLRDSGYRIGIFTSRMSRKWAKSVLKYADEYGEPIHDELLTPEGEAAVRQFLVIQRRYVEETLDRHGIPHDFVTAEKMPSQFYIDDKAIGYRGNWAAVLADSLVV